MKTSITVPGDVTQETRNEILLDMIRTAARAERWHGEHLDKLVKSALRCGIDSRVVSEAVHCVGGQ